MSEQIVSALQMNVACRWTIEGPVCRSSKRSFASFRTQRSLCVHSDNLHLVRRIATGTNFGVAARSVSPRAAVP
jgi:hypothetical protein